MVLVLDQKEVIEALEYFLSKKMGPNLNIDRVKFRRKSSKNDDVGSIVVNFSVEESKV